MKKFDIIKCHNIIAGQIVECEVINPNYNDHQVEAKINEGAFSGCYVVVNKADIVKEEKQNLKGSAKIEFGKFIDEDNNKRYFEVWVTIDLKNDFKSDLEDVYENMVKLMEDNLIIDFFRCPDETDNKIADGFLVDFEYGEMKDKKQEIIDVFKQVKKELNIK